MWFVISKKKHQRAVDLHRSNEEGWAIRSDNHLKLITDRDDLICKMDKKLSSTEREKVLADLESALHLIQDYQRSLSLVCAADPHYTKADALLDKYGLQGNFHKIVDGFQATPYKSTTIVIDHYGKAIDVVDNESFTTRVATEQELKAQTQEDEQVFGSQSYGQEKAALMAERTDEGDRLFFVPQDKEVPENVLVARATTEEASFPETDTIN